MNPIENSFQDIPAIFTSSSAALTLSSTDVVESAYLYWAGSGTGDFEVNLNGIAITAQRTFAFQRFFGDEPFDYFSAFANVTAQVQATGNGNYTLSNLDVTAFIEQHAQIRTNFAGWALIIVYKNNVLPLNQLNVYDGLQNIPIGQVTQPEIALTITLNSLNVIDNNNAKIGFLAWEGDSFLDNNESLRINGALLSNPPLNPATNAFNGTNSFTNSNQLFNMDLDVYPIQNNIAVGDTSAEIKLTSGQDFVMINAIVTKLNSQLPDATIANDQISQVCNSRKLVLNYKVKNFNSTNDLPPNTPIAFYANNVLIGQSATNASIPIDGFENGTISLTIPSSIPNTFTLKLVVDDTGTGVGIVTELLENNNSFSAAVTLYLSPEFNLLPNLTSCNQGFTAGNFDFSNYFDLVKVNSNDAVFFYETLSDATLEINPILNSNNYVAQTTPKTIFVKLKNQFCSSITTFDLITKNCPPTVYNFISDNNDADNPDFFIGGLRDIFIDFKLEIYNRWGKLLWEGNNSAPNWNGEVSIGKKYGSEKAPDGTYFYVLYLNDRNYPDPIVGFLYFVSR